jgi:GR25 family glycosyltransferase involved in LPS biosynthesis
MNNITETYVINLEKSKDRLAVFDKNMKQLNVKYIRWNAVNGSTLEKNNSNTTFMCRNYLCSNGIIGCYLSHVTLWKHILEKHGNSNGNKWFLICEDDAGLTQKTLDNLNNVFNDILNWDESKYLYPDMINLTTLQNSYVKITEYIYKPYMVNGTLCYIVSINGIKKLLKVLDKPVLYHIDMTLTLKQLFNKHIGYYGTKNYIINNDQLESTISINMIPIIETYIINTILFDIFHLNNQLRAMYDSFAFGNYFIGFNALLPLFILISALLLRYEMYDLFLIYIFSEILILYLYKSKT